MRTDNENYNTVNEELTETFKKRKEKAEKSAKQRPETNIIDTKNKLNKKYIEIKDNNVFLINNEIKTNLLTLNDIDEDKINEIIVFIKQLYKI